MEKYFLNLNETIKEYLKILSDEIPDFLYNYINTPLFNIRFIAINDFIESFKNPESVNTILLPFKNLINDEYARDVSIKIRSSLNGKKKRGEFVGSFPSYGYVKDEKDKHKLVIDEVAADIVRKIFDWHVNLVLGKIAIFK